MGTSPTDLTGHLHFPKLFLLLDSFPGNTIYLGLLGSMPIFVGVGKITISPTVDLWCLLKRLVSSNIHSSPPMQFGNERHLFLLPLHWHAHAAMVGLVPSSLSVFAFCPAKDLCILPVPILRPLFPLRLFIVSFLICHGPQLIQLSGMLKASLILDIWVSTLDAL